LVLSSLEHRVQVIAVNEIEISEPTSRGEMLQISTFYALPEHRYPPLIPIDHHRLSQLLGPISKYTNNKKWTCPRHHSFWLQTLGDHLYLEICIQSSVLYTIKISNFEFKLVTTNFSSLYFVINVSRYYFWTAPREELKLNK